MNVNVDARSASDRREVLTKPRVTGIDLARGLAIIGMMMVHLLPSEIETEHGQDPTLSWLLLAGRSAALFAFVAGISLSFMSGGRTGPAAGRPYARVALGIATRAAIISVIGLFLGQINTDVAVILTYYGLMFVVAIPLLRSRPRVLVVASMVAAIFGPFLVTGLMPAAAETDVDPTFSMLLTQPGDLPWNLLITGVYPIVVWSAYIFAGLAAGRLLSVTTPRYAARLLVGGAALAFAAWAVSSLLLGSIGGAFGLAERTDDLWPSDVRNVLIFGYDDEYGRPVSTWWWLAIMAPHTDTPFSTLHTLGTSMAVLGACLLVMRRGGKVFAPIVTIGTMPLTVYTLHVFLISMIDPFGINPWVNLIGQTLLLFGFAWWWSRRFGQGPLEKLLAVATSRVLRRFDRRGQKEAAGR